MTASMRAISPMSVWVNSGLRLILLNLLLIAATYGFVGATKQILDDNYPKREPLMKWTRRSLVGAVLVVSLTASLGPS
jgi:hypothetical protein